jgi:hypothetical protein
MAAVDLTPLVQALLPKSWYPRAKAVVATILSVASAVLLALPYFTQLPEQVGGIVGVVIAVLTPISVYLTGNETPHAAEHEAAAVAQDGTAIPAATD